MFRKILKSVATRLLWISLFVGLLILAMFIVYRAKAAGLLWALIIGLCGFVSLLVGSLVLATFLIYKKLAPQNYYFTSVDEGTAKAVVKGGQFCKFLMAWEDYIINKKTWEITKREEEEKTLWGRFWEWLFGGIRFYGVYPFRQIHAYHFRWTHLHEDGTIKDHDEWIDYVLLKRDLYVIKITQAEDQNQMPLDVVLVVPMRIVNPYCALFVVRRWLQMISGSIEKATREIIGQFSYADIIDPHKPITQQTLVNVIWKHIEENKDHYKTTIGIEIDKEDFGILSIDPSDPKYRELTTKAYTARQEAEMMTITATAEGQAVINRIRMPVWAIAKQLAGVLKDDSKLTSRDIKKISSFLSMAWANYLEDASIKAVKATDKIIVTEGSGIGKLVGRDVARETFRETLFPKNFPEKSKSDSDSKKEKPKTDEEERSDED